jgi:hypothetical protein
MGPRRLACPSEESAVRTLPSSSSSRERGRSAIPITICDPRERPSPAPCLPTPQRPPVNQLGASRGAITSILLRTRTEKREREHQPCPSLLRSRKPPHRVLQVCFPSQQPLRGIGPERSTVSLAVFSDRAHRRRRAEVASSRFHRDRAGPSHHPSRALARKMTRPQDSSVPGRALGQASGVSLGR